MASAHSFKHSKTYPIFDDYEVKNQLGTGKFSVVKKIIKKDTKEVYAVKMIDKKICDNEELVKEVEIMKEINDHPNVIHLIDVYEDSVNFNLVLDLVTGGELFDKIVEYEFYTEKDAADLIYQVASIVKYLHDKNISHRDLKPENLLFEDASAKKLKLCDFGLAEKFVNGKKMFDIVGSPTYMAPEIMENKGYDKSVDMYSIGVIMYILLCGYPPFEPEEGIIELEFPSPEWDGISQNVKDVIISLLSNDPSKRLSSEELLNHPWVSGDQVSKKSLMGTIKTMKMYNTVRREPGATMRQKDKDGKTHVSNIFNNNSKISPPSQNNLNAKNAKKNEIASPKEDNHLNGKKPNKKSKRKSHAPNKPIEGLSFGDKSYLDLSKKMEELKLKDNKAPLSPKSNAQTAEKNPMKEKELTKLKELFMTEKSKKLELEDEKEALQEELDEERKKTSELSEKLETLRQDFEDVQKSLAEEKELLVQFSNERLVLEAELRKSHVDAREASALNARLRRKADELEKENNESESKILEVLKKLNSPEMKIPLDCIVKDKIESSAKIKELQEARNKAVQDLENEKTKGDTMTKEKQKLKSENKKLEKQLDDIVRAIKKLEEEKSLLKCKVDQATKK